MTSTAKSATSDATITAVKTTALSLIADARKLLDAEDEIREGFYSPAHHHLLTSSQLTLKAEENSIQLLELLRQRAV